MGLLSRISTGLVGSAFGERQRFLGLWFLALLLAGIAVGLGLATRDLRPMHTDEAGNAVSVGQALEGTPFVYDPRDRHGPSWFALAGLVVRVAGATDAASLTEVQVRLPSLLAWLALLLTVPWWGRVLPGPAPVLAGVWWACAAPMVYYGGYAIHEPLLVLLTMLAWLVGIAWLTANRPGVRWIWAGILGALIATGLATKETAILALGAVVMALVLAVPVARWRLEFSARRGELALLAATVVAGVLLWFSDGGRHPEGIKNLLGVFAGMGTRAAGAGHESPWSTYLAWYLLPHPRSLPWSGWVLALGFVPGAWLAWRQRRDTPLPWILALSVMILALIHSVIPYKTPWLMLQVLVPGALVAGVGWAALGRGITYRLGWPALVLGGCGALTVLLLETRQLAFRWPVDPANPLAYAHTVPDCERLAERISRQVAGHAGPVAVVGGNPWPLPWYLRRCPQVGYWPDLRALPPVGRFTAVVVLADAGDAERFFPDGWTSRVFGMRPEILAQLYLPPEPP